MESATDAPGPTSHRLLDTTPLHQSIRRASHISLQASSGRVQPPSSSDVSIGRRRGCIDGPARLQPRPTPRNVQPSHTFRQPGMPVDPLHVEDTMRLVSLNPLPDCRVRPLDEWVYRARDTPLKL